MSINRTRGDSGGKDLTNLLANALAKRERSEQQYRDQYVKQWIVIFVNVADTAKPLYSQGEEVVASTLAHFRTIVTTVLKAHEACYIAPSHGPLVVACFEDPCSALNAAIDIQRTMAVWGKTREGQAKLIPAIGLNYGEVEFRDGNLEQSNTCNLAKRVETEASPGQIFLSKHVALIPELDEKYPIEFVKTEIVKNIPEPQDIFELCWEDAVVVQPSAPPKKPEEATSRIQAAMSASIAPPETPAASRYASPIPRKARKPLVEIASVEKEIIEPLIILVIDVCESTKKFWKYGDRHSNQLIRDYRNVVDPIARKHRCVHCESLEGDMMIALFSAEFPAKGLDAAAEIQQVLLKRNISLPENRRVRAAIGLHIGEVKRKGKEVVKGISISVAKTLQGAAVEDEILISGHIYDRLIDQLQYDLRFEKDYKFKDVPEPIPVYKLVWHRDAGSVSSLEQRKLQVGLQNVIRTRLEDGS